MFKKTLLTTLSATVLLASAAQAANNPLHPSYYQDKAGQSVAIQTTNTTRYVDAGNPLNPAYSRNGEAKWAATSDLNVVAYVDSRNPLSPSFKR